MYFEPQIGQIFLDRELWSRLWSAEAQQNGGKSKAQVKLECCCRAKQLLFL